MSLRMSGMPPLLAYASGLNHICACIAVHAAFLQDNVHKQKHDLLPLRSCAQRPRCGQELGSPSQQLALLQGSYKLSSSRGTSTSHDFRDSGKVTHDCHHCRTPYLGFRCTLTVHERKACSRFSEQGWAPSRAPGLAVVECCAFDSSKSSREESYDNVHDHGVGRSGLDV